MSNKINSSHSVWSKKYSITMWHSLRLTLKVEVWRGVLCYIYHHSSQISIRYSLPVFGTQLYQMQTLTLAFWKWSHTPWKLSTFEADIVVLPHLFFLQLFLPWHHSLHLCFAWSWPCTWYIHSSKYLCLIWNICIRWNYKRKKNW